MSSEPSFAERMAAIRQRAEEHRARMDADPAYRAEVEAEEAKRAAEEAERARLDAIEQRRSTRMWCREKMGIPKRLHGLLEEPSDTASTRAAREFLSSRETILVLAGGTGCGKTVAASVALDVNCAQDREAGRATFKSVMPEDSGRMVKAIDLSRASSFDREFWEGLTRPNLLVIDDLGTEPLDDKGWALANIRALIDQRYDDASKTVLTTNLTLEQFKGRYCLDGGRLADRLREAGAFVEIAETSMRRAMP